MNWGLMNYKRGNSIYQYELQCIEYQRFLLFLKISTLPFFERMFFFFFFSFLESCLYIFAEIPIFWNNNNNKSTFDDNISFLMIKKVIKQKDCVTERTYRIILIVAFC